MRLLDLFCGAGGAAEGYHRAGFDEIVGVDIKPQPRYPFKFVLADAMTYPLDGFDAIHASPPCQFHSMMRKGRWQDRKHPELVGPIRERLQATGKPYVIENVLGAAKFMRNPILLCGTMFGLKTAHGSQLLRHRLFETNAVFALTPCCAHNGASAIGVYGGGQHPRRRKRLRLADRETPEAWDFGIKARKEAMGIHWMTSSELSQAIPPAYTEFIGKRLLKELRRRKAA